MLSILIPIFNFDVRDFVAQLSKQSETIEVEVEIVCLDDASEIAFRTLNQDISKLPNVRCVQSEENLGRSAVRNALVELAKYNNLLFLDCDGLCVSDDYLDQYEAAWHDYDVIYGGRVYNEEAPDDHDLYFHWYCGSNREAILVEQRKLDPFKSFMTNNFLIRRSIYEKVKMDESITGYGHEDTLFAQELKRAEFTIKHIQNPIEHIGIEPFDVFMEKSENGVKNLAKLMALGKVDSSIRLVKYHYKLKPVMWLIAPLVRLFEKQLMHNLKGPAPNLMWFDVWKLVLLSRL